MRCSLCQRDFSEESSRLSCGGCIIPGCNLMRCPYCHYENPGPSKIAELIQRWRGQ